MTKEISEKSNPADNALVAIIIDFFAVKKSFNCL
jgi:hypothetical protein